MRGSAQQRAGWPVDREALLALQVELGRSTPRPYPPPAAPWRVAGCFFCCARAAVHATEWGWAGAARLCPGEAPAIAVHEAAVVAPYEAGLLALREGSLLAAAVQALPGPIDLLLVNATGRDHPRRAGLAVHLGAALDLPTVGVTNRPLLAVGAPPEDRTLASAPLSLDGDRVGFWLRARAGTRPLAVHAGWRLDSDAALEVVSRLVGEARTPAPIRLARQMARAARARAGPRPFG